MTRIFLCRLTELRGGYAKELRRSNIPGQKVPIDKGGSYGYAAVVVLGGGCRGCP